MGRVQAEDEESGELTRADSSAEAPEATSDTNDRSFRPSARATEAQHEARICQEEAERQAQKLLAEPMSRPINARPGTGGRRRRVSAAAETEATAELREAVGEPILSSSGGVRMHRWLAERAREGNEILSPDGDGILVARLSAQDVQRGETVMGQIHRLLLLVQQSFLKPREILVTTNNSGYLRFDQRQDFAKICDEISNGRIKWVAFRSPERIGRDLTDVLQFYRLLQDTGTHLYLASLGRTVDWSTDRLTLHALGMVGDEEGRLIRERTRGAIERRWLEEGRGWPSSIKLGFRRNEHTKFLEVDPEQWPWIKRMHYGYAAAWEESGQGHGGLRYLARELAAEGFDISIDRLRKALQVPVYVTGEWYVNHEGRPVACRPIVLNDPVPADVFENNLRLMRMRKGKNSVTPLGTHVLNRVRVVHAVCRDQEVELDGRLHTPQLRARRWSGGRKAIVRPTYAHVPKVPSCCRGYTIDAQALDAAVIRALREFCESPELQEAYTALAFPEIAPVGEALDEEHRRQLEVRLRNGERAIERLNREWADHATSGEGVTLADFKRAVAPIEADVESIRRQMANSNAIAEARRSRTQRLSADERATLVERLHEILTDECPDDPERRLRRAAFVEAAVSEVIIHDVPDSEAPLTAAEAGEHRERKGVPQGGTRRGQIRIELRGPLVPPAARFGEPFDPLAAARSALDDTPLEEDTPSETDTRGEVVDLAAVRAGKSASQDDSAPEASVRSQGDRQYWLRQSRWEHHPRLELDDDLLAQPSETAGKYRRMRGDYLRTGRPAWVSTLIEVPDLSFHRQPTPLSLGQVVEALLAALTDLAPERLNANPAGSSKPYDLWQRDHPQHPSLYQIGRFAKARGQTIDDLVKLAAQVEATHMPTDAALEHLERKGAAKDPAMAPPPDEVVIEHWRCEFDRAVAVLMRLSPRLPEKAPFGPKGYRGFAEADPSLPSYATLFYASRRHGSTPLQLLAHARAKLAAGESPPEPVMREFADVPDVRLGRAAIDEALKRPYIRPNIRSATQKWTLNECLDALVDAVPHLIAGKEFGPTGYGVLSRGRADLPTLPTLTSVCGSHGVTLSELFVAAKSARESGRGLTDGVPRAASPSPQESGGALPAA